MEASTDPMEARDSRPDNSDLCAYEIISDMIISTESCKLGIVRDEQL